MATVPLILDVDTGIDDALALAYAINSPTAELVAVTTLAGNVGVEGATANTLDVLDWLGAAKVPVHRGASRALVRLHKDASHFHGADGLGGAALPAGSRAIGADRGPAAIVRLATARPGELTLVCLGPLTNLAIALNVEPRLPGLLQAVVVMGGAYRVPGNVTPTAEFNIYADPEAAAQVFAAPFPRLTAVGLDVSRRTTLPRAVWQAAARGEGTGAASELAARVGRAPFGRGLAGLELHDPLAVAVALDPSLVGTRQAAVAVDLAGALGATRSEAPGQVLVAETVEAERFVADFVRRLGLPIGAMDRGSPAP